MTYELKAIDQSKIGSYPCKVHGRHQSKCLNLIPLPTNETNFCEILLSQLQDQIVKQVCREQQEVETTQLLPLGYVSVLLKNMEHFHPHTMIPLL